MVPRITSFSPGRFNVIVARNGASAQERPANPSLRNTACSVGLAPRGRVAPSRGEANLGMIADDEFIAWLGREMRCLRQVVEPTIDNPELWPIYQSAHSRNQVPHEAGVVGIAIRMPVHGQNQARTHVQGHQRSAA